jgi:hypothetical protein
VPYGWIDFCRRHGMECDHGQLPPLNINLAAEALGDI